LRGGVLEGDLGLLVVVDVGEFVGVLVGEEEEVWPDTLRGVSVKSSRILCSRTYFGNGHRARHWTKATTDGGQQANLQTINSLVELFYLLLLGCFIVPLLGD